MKSEQNITTQRVLQLLEKYFEGTTTLEQEQYLREYFTSGNTIPPELSYAQAMFGYFRDAAEDTGKPAVHPAQLTQGSGVSKPFPKSRRGLLYYLAGAVTTAAIIALIVTVTPGRQDLTPYEETVYCYVNGEPVTDPALALEYSQMAFGHLSQTINGSLPEVNVFGAFEKLEYLEGFGKILDMIKQTN